MQNILEIAAKLDIEAKDLLCYGQDKAKLKMGFLNKKRRGKLVLMTAMSPSPAGEGKTTVAIGLVDALCKSGQRAAVALREPSMGPVFGMKGGGAGGGKAQLYPAEDINLHFTGDFHAITSAHNLLAAALDNHIHFGNELRFDLREPTWNRVLDVNDRVLRDIVIGLGGKMGGVPRQSRFDITAASEIMAILALAKNQDDLSERLANIVIGRSSSGDVIRAGQLKVQGSLLVLLKDALLPNLVQTLEGSPAFVHAGPFANIAHGTNSVLATQAALVSADIVLQEAGFGADLGAEKFVNIFCPVAEVRPSLAILVCTLRAMRYHAGIAQADIGAENPQAIRDGLCNPQRHIENLKSLGMDVIVAINTRPDDTANDLQVALEAFRTIGVTAIITDVFQRGSAGAVELASKVTRMMSEPEPGPLREMYSVDDTISEKLSAVARDTYRATTVSYSKSAEKQLRTLEQQGFGKLRVCIAKTQYSFSDDPSKVGVVDDHEIHIRELRLAAGAGFIVAVVGEMMTMPGLARVPNLEKIRLDTEGKAVLF